MNGSVTLTTTTRMRDLIALTKPRVTLLNQIALAAGFLLAPASGGPGAFLLTLAGTTLVIGSANALNCYLERDLDARMSRTRNRPLPAGRLAPAPALLFGLGLGLFGVALLTFAVHPLPGLIAALALVAYVLVYTPMKPKSAFALIVGAVPGAAPPLIGWTAATGSVELPGALLFLLVFLWQIPHFIAITLYRRQEYAQAGFRVLAVEAGEGVARAELIRYALAMVATSFVFGMVGAAGAAYLVAAAVLGAPMLYLAVQGVRGGDARWARRFFMATNLYLMLLFAALLADRYLG